MEYRWTNCVKDFSMPLKVSLKKGTSIWINPAEQWEKLSITGDTENSLTVDRNFYVGSKLKEN